MAFVRRSVRADVRPYAERPGPLLVKSVLMSEPRCSLAGSACVSPLTVCLAPEPRMPGLP